MSRSALSTMDLRSASLVSLNFRNASLESLTILRACSMVVSGRSAITSLVEGEMVLMVG